MPILKALMPWGPVFFGLGFLAPLIATLMVEANIPAPAGLDPLQTGLLSGLLLGLVARYRGRWL